MLARIRRMVSAVPRAPQMLSHLDPLRPYLVVLRGRFLKGVGLRVLWPQIPRMAAFAIVLFAARVRRSRRRSTEALTGIHSARRFTHVRSGALNDYLAGFQGVSDCLQTIAVKRQATMEALSLLVLSSFVSHNSVQRVGLPCRPKGRNLAGALCLCGAE